MTAKNRRFVHKNARNGAPTPEKTAEIRHFSSLETKLQKGVDRISKPA